MKFAILGFLVVVVIGFLVLVYKAAKAWRWYQIVAVVFTMLLAITFIFPTAGVLKSRAAWHKVKEDLEARAEASGRDQKSIKYGDPNDPTAGEGIVTLSQQLSKLGVEAGRRWRNLVKQNADVQSIKLVQQRQDAALPPGVPAADPPAGDSAPAPAPAGPLVPQGLVVYGFAEAPVTVNQTQVLVPNFYLGQFRVSASGPNDVTLTPTGKLEPQQEAAIGGQLARSWTIYELLPLDGHEPFIAEGSVPGEDNYFGRVDDTLVKSLLADASEETIAKYLRDGSRTEPDDPPLSRWVKIEFTKPYSENVDSPEQRGALDGGFFDATGRAVDSRLQRGGEGDDKGKVKFKPGEQILVKEEAWNQLEEEGAARLVDTYYLRPMNDYRFVLHHIRLRLEELAIRKVELAFSKQVLDEAIAATDSMLTTNQEVKLKLEQDFAQIEIERKAIQSYQSELQDNVDQTRQTLIRLYRKNQEMEDELEKIHLSIKARLDAVTAAP